MRIGIRGAISGLVLASIIVSAVGVHFLWWRTALRISQTLATTINEQIVSAVGDELQSITSEGRSTFIATGRLFRDGVLDTRDAGKRQAVFLSQLRAQPTVSWLAFGWPDGSFFAGHKLGEDAIEVMTIAGGEHKLRIDRYVYEGFELQLKDSRIEDTKYGVIDQEWFREVINTGGARWFTLTTHPNGEWLAAAFAGPVIIGQQREGVLAVIFELTRVSSFLSQLTVGKSAGAFILDRNGGVIASPDPDANEITPLKTDHPLFPIAVDAIRQSRDYDPDQGQPVRTTVRRGGESYQAVITPISFPGWSLVTVVPESEFLGPVQMTIRNLLIGLAILIVAAGLLSAWLAQRLIAAPLLKVMGEIKHIERFDLDKVERHPSRLAEIENLSGAIADMAQGLAAFRKYIPADLVKLLISEGTEAKLGGDIRFMTVMFIDLAGFTGMSERMGSRIIPLLSRYFDLVSVQVQANGGTIDKFIGDAVMAFWGAPRVNAQHAVDCCRAALACQRAVLEADLRDDASRPVKIRIGINSGDMLVGNIGSEVRLNYTVIGDAVNIASRLESTNKQYGSDIIIGPETRRLAGDRILVRELDRLAVYGRAGGLQIYELLGMAGEETDAAGWIEHYGSGLAAYRAQDFAGAIGHFQEAIDVRGQDTASSAMIERCRQLLNAPVDGSWSDTTVARIK
jgi:adenylate cyclase